jgi:hypothetical protein
MERVRREPYLSKSRSRSIDLQLGICRETEKEANLDDIVPQPGIRKQP